MSVTEINLYHFSDLIKDDEEIKLLYRIRKEFCKQPTLTQTKSYNYNNDNELSIALFELFEETVRPKMDEIIDTSSIKMEKVRVNVIEFKTEEEGIVYKGDIRSNGWVAFIWLMQDSPLLVMDENNEKCSRKITAKCLSLYFINEKSRIYSVHSLPDKSAIHERYAIVFMESSSSLTR